MVRAGATPTSGSRSTRSMKKFWAFAFCMLASASAPGEVVSLTLGIDVNSPYGISEPWATIRAGLLRLDYVDSVAELPDRKTATGEMRTKNGRVPDVEALAKALLELGAGAKLRGVEATVDGKLSKRGEELLLHVSKTGETLRLAPFTKPVQRGIDAKESETSAFAGVSSALSRDALEARITGPLRAPTKAGELQTLEVRRFDFSGRTQNQTNQNN
jgi:hypothetical protein